MSARARTLWSRVRRGFAGLGTAALLGAMVVTAPPAADAAPVPWTYDTTASLLGLAKEHSPAPTVTDWDGDGRDDLVVGLRKADQWGGVAVALRQVDGGLSDPQTVFATPGAGLTGDSLYLRPAVGDWDGDGDDDLLLGSYASSRGVLFCPRTGVAGAAVVDGTACAPLRTTSGALVGATTASGIAHVSPELVDWDLDGDLDLLVGTGTLAAEKGVRLYENTGSSTAPALADGVMVASKAGTVGLAFENYYEPTLVDINDDGRRDLLIAGGQFAPTQEFALRQCLNTGSDSNPVYGSCTYLRLPGLVNNVVDATDWDGDGYLDLVRGFHSAFIANPVTLLHGTAPDTDGDGVSDSLDNCLLVPNPPDLMLDKVNAVQIDTDGDGRGDVCDADDDGDAVLDDVDNCQWTPNAVQSDVDVDGRGDECDARDDRPEHPGAGSYEVAQVDRIDWGRKPVIILRADAMSIGYRQGIAEALTTEALDRGLAFSLAVIPWDTARFAASPGPAFVNSVIDDPNFEIVHHGTYHACVYTPWIEEHGASAAEFDCGMDVARSFNLMRVGAGAMRDALDLDHATHQMTGFIPPTDAYDAAAGEAMQALGYRWVSSAWYAEPAGREDFAYVDASGLVHIPWSQIACGNGAATWTDCQKGAMDGIGAHSGTDCDDAGVCAPAKDGKDYSDWAKFADTSLADRCENDFARYGLCEVLFELTSYDGDFATGTLDPRAFAAYQQTLTELQDLAARTGAVFMTLGDYAAALQAEDHTAPQITIASPTASAYGHHEMVGVDVDVTDALSGVHDVAVTLDTKPVQIGDTIDLLDLALGEHVLAVTAEDRAGNSAHSSVTFIVVATLASLRATVERYAADGTLPDVGVVTALLQQLDAAQASIDRGLPRTAGQQLSAFESLLRAQSGKHVPVSAAELLVADSAAVRSGLG